MQTELNLSWLFEHQPAFRKYYEEVKAVKEDEQRYRDKPGYVPKLEAKEQLEGRVKKV